MEEKRERESEKARETLLASRKLNLAAWTSSKHVGPTGPAELPPSFTSLSTFSTLPSSLSISFRYPAIVKRLFYKSFRRETGDIAPFKASAAILVSTGRFRVRRTGLRVRERNYRSDKRTRGRHLEHCNLEERKNILLQRVSGIL